MYRLAEMRFPSLHPLVYLMAKGTHAWALGELPRDHARLFYMEQSDPDTAFPKLVADQSLVLGSAWELMHRGEAYVLHETVPPHLVVELVDIPEQNEVDYWIRRSVRIDGRIVDSDLAITLVSNSLPDTARFVWTHVVSERITRGGNPLVFARRIYGLFEKAVGQHLASKSRTDLHHTKKLVASRYAELCSLVPGLKADIDPLAETDRARVHDQVALFLDTQEIGADTLTPDPVWVREHLEVALEFKGNLRTVHLKVRSRDEQADRPKEGHDFLTQLLGYIPPEVMVNTEGAELEVELSPEQVFERMKPHQLELFENAKRALKAYVAAFHALAVPVSAVFGVFEKSGLPEASIVAR